MLGENVVMFCYRGLIVLQDSVWDAQLHRSRGTRQEGTQLRGGRLVHWLHTVSEEIFCALIHI